MYTQITYTYTYKYLNVHIYIYVYVHTYVAHFEYHILQRSLNIINKNYIHVNRIICIYVLCM